MLNLKERTKTKKHHIIHNTVISVRRKKVESEATVSAHAHTFETERWRDE